MGPELPEEMQTDPRPRGMQQRQCSKGESLAAEFAVVTLFPLCPPVSVCSGSYRHGGGGRPMQPRGKACFTPHSRHQALSLLGWPLPPVTPPPL